VIIDYSSQNMEESYKSRVEANKKLVGELKAQWNLLWSERFDDKQRAECISANDYSGLLVERGMVIHATRAFKALSFKEILERQKVENPERYVQFDAHDGGWHKFIKTEIKQSSLQKSRLTSSNRPKIGLNKHENSQARKGGRGWLHKI
jgi:hypothetical protein